MRRVDKKHNMQAANVLAEERYIESKTVLTEDITAGGYTFYHRTPEIPTIFNHGYVPGKGDFHGVGLYGCYDMGQQLKDGMLKYGKYLTEFTLTNSAGIVILDYVQSKKVNGAKYTLLDQLDRIMGSNFKGYYAENKDILQKYQKQLADGLQWTSEISKKIHTVGNYRKLVDGTSYTGENDGPCIVLFETNLANPIRYSVDNAESWINIKDSKEAYNIGKDQRGPTKRQAKINLGLIPWKELESDDERMSYCKYTIKKHGSLDTVQFAWAPDDIKLLACTTIHQRNNNLRENEFEWVPYEMKLESCINTINFNGGLADYQWDWASDEIKLKSCNAVLSRYGYFTIPYQAEWYRNYYKLL